MYGYIYNVCVCACVCVCVCLYLYIVLALSRLPIAKYIPTHSLSHTSINMCAVGGGARRAVLLSS